MAEHFAKLNIDEIITSLLEGETEDDAVSGAGRAVPQC